MARHDIEAPPIPGDWVEQAACVGVDPEIMFPAVGHKDSVKAARAVCAVCPVAVECLDYALKFSTFADHGVWGGKTPAERRRLRAIRRLPRRPVLVRDQAAR